MRPFFFVVTVEFLVDSILEPSLSLSLVHVWEATRSAGLQSIVVQKKIFKLDSIVAAIDC